jgi:hypothetical protein
LETGAVEQFSGEGSTPKADVCVVAALSLRSLFVTLRHRPSFSWRLFLPAAVPGFVSRVIEDGRFG